MGRKTLFDAFNAVAGSTETALGIADKYLEKRAQQKVFDEQLKNQEQMHQFMIDLQNSNDWENYEKEWENFKTNIYNESAKNFKSAYGKELYTNQFKAKEMQQRLVIKGIANDKMRLQDRTRTNDRVQMIIDAESYGPIVEKGKDGKDYTISATQQKKRDIDNALYEAYESGLLNYKEFNERTRLAYSNLLLSEMVKQGKQAVDGKLGLNEVYKKVDGIQGEYMLDGGGVISADALRDKAKRITEGYFYQQRRIRWEEAETKESAKWNNILATVMDPKADESDVGGKSSIEKARDIAKNALQEIKYIQAQQGELIDPKVAVHYQQKYYDFLQNIDKYIKSGNPLAVLGSLSPKEFAQVYVEKFVHGVNSYDGNETVKVYKTADKIVDLMKSDIREIAKMKGIPPAYVYPGIIEEFYKQVKDALPEQWKAVAKDYKDTYEALYKYNNDISHLSPEDEVKIAEGAPAFLSGLLNLVSESKYIDLNKADPIKMLGKLAGKLYDTHTGSSGILWGYTSQEENTGNLVKQTTTPGVITRDAKTKQVIINPEAQEAVNVHENTLRREFAISLGIDYKANGGKFNIIHDPEANRIYCTYGSKKAWFETDAEGKAILKIQDLNTKKTKTIDTLSESAHQKEKEAQRKRRNDERKEKMDISYMAQKLPIELKPLFDSLKSDSEKQRLLDIFNNVEQDVIKNKSGAWTKEDSEKVKSLFNK